jgi:hypothetical protein
MEVQEWPLGWPNSTAPSLLNAYQTQLRSQIFNSLICSQVGCETRESVITIHTLAATCWEDQCDNPIQWSASSGAAQLTIVRPEGRLV